MVGGVGMWLACKSMTDIGRGKKKKTQEKHNLTKPTEEEMKNLR